MGNQRPTLCIVGSGPRGLSTLERVCANAARTPHIPLTVHIVDPEQPGAGRVWRSSQSRHLLMNTVASQVTMFTDDSVEMDGPQVSGPSLYEWAQLMTVLGPDEEPDRDTLAEARRLGPDTYPTRAFYGRYLEWVFDRVVALAPDHVRIVSHRTRAVALDDAGDAPDGPQSVRLENGSVLTDLDGVVLTMGHLDAEVPPALRALHDDAARLGLRHLLPVNPAEAELDGIAPGEPVILRGLGLNFFDYLSLFSHGRGGVFEEQAGRLVYRPSGREPRMIAGSRRGVPYHARGENEKGPHGRHVPLLLTDEKIQELRERAELNSGLDLRADVWPLVAREAEAVYYTALVARGQGAPAADRFRELLLATVRDSPQESALLERSGIGAADRWDWEQLARPHGGTTFEGPADFQNWLLDLLRRDVADALAGNVSGPRKAALDALRDLRNEIRLLVDHGGLTAASHRQDLDLWYTPLNAFLSIGPPARRIEEMTALIEAGLLTVVGPDLRVELQADRGVFAASSPCVPGSGVEASVLIEARLPDIDLRRTTDPLLRHLKATGQCASHLVHGPSQPSYQTGGLAVTRRPYHLLDGEGRAHPRRFAFGVPTEAVHWVTAAGIRPGVNSVTLGDSDAVARAALALTGSLSLTRSDATVGSEAA